MDYNAQSETIKSLELSQLGHIIIIIDLTWLFINYP